MVSLRQLEMFSILAERGNMGEAAQALGLTQPALSQQLKALEERLGLKLFERIPRGMRLTMSGRELLASTRSTLASSREFLDMAARAAERPVGAIRFGVTPTLGPYLMPGVIQKLHRRFPDLKLYVREGIPDRQHQELAAGDLDMVLSPLPIAAKGLVVEPLFREPLRIVAPPDDPLLAGGRPPVAAFSGRTFLTLDHRHHYHRQLVEICDGLNARILADYQGTSLDALQQMAGSGVGLAVLPQLYVRSEAGGLAAVDIAEPADWNYFRSIAAAWRESAAYRDVFKDIATVIAEEARARLDPHV